MDAGRLVGVGLQLNLTNYKARSYSVDKSLKALNGNNTSKCLGRNVEMVDEPALDWTRGSEWLGKL